MQRAKNQTETEQKIRSREAEKRDREAKRNHTTRQMENFWGEDYSREGWATREADWESVKKERIMNKKKTISFLDNKQQEKKENKQRQCGVFFWSEGRMIEWLSAAFDGQAGMRGWMMSVFDDEWMRGDDWIPSTIYLERRWQRYWQVTSVSIKWEFSEILSIDNSGECRLRAVLLIRLP